MVSYLVFEIHQFQIRYLVLEHDIVVVHSRHTRQNPHNYWIAFSGCVQPSPPRAPNKALILLSSEAVEKFLDQIPYLCPLNLGILAPLLTPLSLKLLKFNNFSTTLDRGHAPLCRGIFVVHPRNLKKLPINIWL